MPLHSGSERHVQDLDGAWRLVHERPVLELINFYLIPGLVLGAVYALAAAGISLVYGVMRFANFAHGDLMTWGAYMALLAVGVFGVSPWVALLFAVAATVPLAWGLDRAFYAPLRRSAPAVLLISSFAVALMLRAVVYFVWGPTPGTYARGFTPPFIFEGIRIQQRHVIILGGAVEQLLTERRGIPALNGAAERMTEAVILARQHPEARIIFTGGQGTVVTGEKTEADVARELWSGMGLDGPRVILENQSRNTWENATLTHALIQPKPGERWLLVTSASHMPRSVGCFRRAGWEVTAWPVNYSTSPGGQGWFDPPFSFRLGQAEWAVREYVGLIAYRLLGRTSAFFPAP